MKLFRWRFVLELQVLYDLRNGRTPVDSSSAHSDRPLTSQAPERGYPGPRARTKRLPRWLEPTRGGAVAPTASYANRMADGSLTACLGGAIERCPSRRRACNVTFSLHSVMSTLRHGPPGQPT